MPDVDVHLRLLRAFVVVAEELNVTRAAARLHLTQPALSRQVRQLETELRVALLEREPHGVRLTDAGGALLQRAPRLLREWTATAAAVQAAAYQGRTSLRVGSTSATADDLAPAGAAPDAGDAAPGSRGPAPAGVLRLAVSSEADPEQQQILTAYSHAPGAAAVHLIPTASTSSRVRAVVDGGADAAFVRLARSPHPGLRYRRLAAFPLLLAAPAGHPLTAIGEPHEPVALGHLDGRPLAFYHREQNPWWYDDVLGLLHRHGATMPVVHRGLWAYDVLPVVAAGNAVALVSRRAAAAIALPGVAYRRLDPAPVIHLGLLWRDDAQQPAGLRALVELAGVHGADDG